MTEKIKICRGIDTWSMVHLLGSHFLMTVFHSWTLVFLLGILWEAADYLYSCFRNELPEELSLIFDPRGADITDLLFDLAGIVLYIITK